MRLQAQSTTKIVAVKEDNNENLHLEVQTSKKVYKVEEVEDEKDFDLSQIPNHPVVIIGPLGMPMTIEPSKLPVEHQKQFLQIWQEQQKLLKELGHLDENAKPDDNKTIENEQDDKIQQKILDAMLERMLEANPLLRESSQNPVMREQMIQRLDENMRKNKEWHAQIQAQIQSQAQKKAKKQVQMQMNTQSQPPTSSPAGSHPITAEVQNQMSPRSESQSDQGMQANQDNQGMNSPNSTHERASSVEQDKVEEEVK